MKFKRAFTMVEMLVVIAIIGILAALLLPVLNRAKASAKRTACLANLKQISLGLHMYADDESDKTPKPEGVSTNKVLSVTGYKRMISAYVGSTPQVAQKSRLFTCPADVFYYWPSNGNLAVVQQPLYEQSGVDFSSYGFNGGNLNTNYNRLGIDVGEFGIAGRSIASIRNPSKTILAAELPAFDPFSWHKPKKPFGEENAHFNGSMNIVGFVDGHAAFIKMYWADTSKTNQVRLSANYINPPPGYDYQWSGN